MVLDSQGKYSIHADVGERIALSEGNPKKAADLIRFDLERHDQRMNEFASLKEFHVILKAEE